MVDLGVLVGIGVRRGRPTGKLALTSSSALPATPAEILNSSYVWTFRTAADVPTAFLLSLIGAAKAPESERKIVSGVEKCMIAGCGDDFDK